MTRWLDRHPRAQSAIGWVLVGDALIWFGAAIVNTDRAVGHEETLWLIGGVWLLLGLVLLARGVRQR